MSPVPCCLLRGARAAIDGIRQIVSGDFALPSPPPAPGVPPLVVGRTHDGVTLEWPAVPVAKLREARRRSVHRVLCSAVTSLDIADAAVQVVTGYMLQCGEPGEDGEPSALCVRCSWPSAAY
jgi:hypothetical protein